MKCLGALLVICLLASSSWADSFDKSRVSGSATWVIHLDVEKLVRTQAGQQLLDELAQGRNNDRLAAFQDLFTLDVQKGLRGVTAYGFDVNTPDGVAVATGTFDVRSMAQTLQGREGYTQQRHGTRTIHGWLTRQTIQGTDASGKTVTRQVNLRNYACLMDGSSIIVSSRLEAARIAVDVIDGKKPILSSKYILDQMRLVGPNTFLIGAVELGRADLSAVPGGLARNLQNACLFMGETKNTVVSIAEGEATTAEAANQLKVLLMGAIASALLQADRRPDLARLAKRSSVSTNGNRVNLTVKCPASEFVTLVKKGTLFSSADYLMQPPKGLPGLPGWK